MKHKRALKVILIILGSILLLLGGLTILNKTYHTSYDKMDTTDQSFFKQLNTLYTKTTKELLWQDYNLADKPVLFVRKGDHLNFSEDTINLIRGNVYAVGVKGLEGKWYATKIAMPRSYKMPDVYRLAVTTPGIWSTWNPIGNFSSFSIDDSGQEVRSNMQLADSSYVYYFKYGKNNIENPVKASQSAMPFFAHEAFHYLQQYDWHTTDGNIDVASKDVDWYSLLGLQYSILDTIMDATGKQDKAALEKALSDYVVVSDARRKQGISDYQNEKQHETIEGTATYVGIKASAITGGKPKQLKLLEGARDEKSRKFAVLFEGIAYDPSFVSEIKWNRYDSGALLSSALDIVDSTDWQTTFNKKASANKAFTLDDELHQLNNLAEPRMLAEIEKSYHFENIQALSKKIVDGLQDGNN
ncbi:hypothetical protein [Listeria booriae]|uniref:hypothetical protein n=1 Tax=Listeria booriae TaxID=1552123 RepID=UPI001628EE26|nr:hypothetical protein [Listeria booriae]MBC2323749.1 hypothetical protein [Listeria booriae]MCD2207632.1 hypothetical protein [Listeria booriae]